MLRFFKTVGTTILTIAPPVFWTQYLASKKKDIRANRNLSRTLFVIGIFLIIPIIVAELILTGLNPFTNGTLLHNLLNDFAFIAFVEEFFKWAGLALLTAKHKHKHGRYNCIIWAVAVSLGFAMIENVLYVRKAADPFAVATLRMFLCIPSHMCYAIWMGCFYGLSRVHLTRGNIGRTLVAASLSILVPAGLHGINNFLVSMSMMRLSIFFDIVIFVVSIVTTTVIAHKTTYDEDLRLDRPCVIRVRTNNLLTMTR